VADEALYDRIGVGYTATRRTDPRIAEHIWAALGDARSVLNVGAGTGSYEPDDRAVVRAEVEALPFEDRTFDTALRSRAIARLPDTEWRPGGIAALPAGPAARSQSSKGRRRGTRRACSSRSFALLVVQAQSAACCSR